MPLSPAPIQQVLVNLTRITDTIWVRWFSDLTRMLNDYSVDPDRGIMSMAYNSTVTAIASSGVAYKIAGTMSASSLNKGFSFSNNKLTLSTGIRRVYTISATLDAHRSPGSGSADTFRVEIYVNNSAVRGIICGLSHGEPIPVSIQHDIVLSSGDYVEIYITNETGTHDVTVENMYVRVC